MEEIQKQTYEQLKAKFPEQAYEDRKASGFNMTTIDAYHIIDRLNNIFGLCGIGWGFGHLDYQIHDNDVACIGEFWYKIKGTDQINIIKAVGDGPFYSKDKEGGNRHYSIAEAMKKAQTNMISKAVSYIGVGLDVFMGNFDADPYKKPEGASYPRSRDINPVVGQAVASTKSMSAKPSGFAFAYQFPREVREQCVTTIKRIPPGDRHYDGTSYTWFTKEKVIGLDAYLVKSASKVAEAINEKLAGSGLSVEEDGPNF